MALLKGPLPVVAVGVGAAIVAPMVVPAIASVGRPLAKSALKGCLAIADQTRELLAEFGEQWGDLVAEVRSERTVTAAAESATTSKARSARA